ncbi:ABC transporter ATP-binding protein [Arthrobacter sp. Ld5]|uniref:ABC transporter ATP-binding protein n=1 Tax=Arthrobacter sp. Ld5 TaxID=649152 RepID=UPI003EBF366E
MANVISARSLAKHYGRVHALDGLDLEVEEGQIHGFLGPNGSGKSTTTRVLLGLARATSGIATVFGADPWREAAALHRRIASVPGDVSVWPNLSGGETIDFVSRLRGVRRNERAYRLERERLMEVFLFDPRKKGRAYSKGNRQKLALIAAFAVPADLYILDEPTSGLDPLMAMVFQREIARVREGGATVLLSSHILSEVEQLCDVVSIVRAGKVVESGTLADLRHLTRTEVSFAAADAFALESVPHAHDVRFEHGRARFTVDSDRVSSVLPALTALHVEGLRIEPPSLEELFLRHYGDDLAAGGQDAPGSEPREAATR